MIIKDQLKTAKIFGVLFFLWVLNGCSYQHPPIRHAPQLTSPAEVKTVMTTDAPKTIEPKTQAHVRLAKIPDKIDTETRSVAPEAPVPVTPPPSRSPEPRFYEHKVQWPGETISVIANWYTGTANNWKAIADANPTLNPRQILIGDTIFIPENLLTSRKPMPLSFVQVSVQKKISPQPSSSDTKSTPSEPPELFGPIETEQTSINSKAIELFAPIE